MFHSFGDVISFFFFFNCFKIHFYKMLLREIGSRKIIGLRNTEQVDFNQRTDYLGADTLCIIFLSFFGEFI